MMNQAITLPPPPYHQPSRTSGRYSQPACCDPLPPTGVLDELFRKPLEDTANRLAKVLRERTPENFTQLNLALHEAGNRYLPEDELRVRCTCSFHGGSAL